MTNNKIVGIGESVLDIIFRNEQPAAAVPGGSTFNCIVSLGRTVGVRYPGTRIIMVTQTGDDHVGDVVCDFLEKNNVSSEGVYRKQNSQSTVSLAFLDENNDAKYSFYRGRTSENEQLKFIDVKFGRGDIVVFGSYFAVNPALREYTHALMKSAHDAGAIIYYDVNYRKNHLSDLPVTRKYIEENIAMSDVVRASDEDIACVFGNGDPDIVYRDIISSLCRNYICTKGGNPVSVYTASGTMEFPVPSVNTVSTIGAGDNFNAGFVYGLIEKGIDKDNINSIPSSAWKDIVSIATKFSSNVCQSLFNYVDEDFVKSL